MFFGQHAAEVFFLSSAALLTTTVTFAGLWVRARERAVRAEAILDGARLSGMRSDSTNPALDAIAEEVERIGEGQRFLTRVMSEQANRAGLPSQRPPGSITPH
jgi:hypothetical protein